jgi:hypothetical protein
MSFGIMEARGEVCNPIHSHVAIGLHMPLYANDGAEHRRAEFLLRPWSLADRMRPWSLADRTFVGCRASVRGRTMIAISPDLVRSRPISVRGRMRGPRGGACHGGRLKPCQPPHAGRAPCRALACGRLTRRSRGGAPCRARTRVRCRGNGSRRRAVVARGVGGGAAQRCLGR